MAVPKKINYLNNKDILKEIHTSKNSYCSFVDPEYHRYDLIIDKPEGDIIAALTYATKLTQIKAAKEVRASRLSVETGVKVDPKTIKKEDLIFRVMTWDHVPVAQKQPRKAVKKKTAKDIFIFVDDDNDDFSDLDDKVLKDEVEDMVHVKVNFPPFHHCKYIRAS